MIRRLIILLLIVGCEELLDSTKHGCIDSQACNYDADATIDNNSCIFSEENYDCDGICIATGNNLDENGLDCSEICAGDDVELWDSCYSIEEINFLDLSYNELFGLVPDNICYLVENGIYFNISFNSFCPSYPECLITEEFTDRSGDGEFQVGECLSSFGSFIAACDTGLDGMPNTSDMGEGDGIWQPGDGWIDDGDGVVDLGTFANTQDTYVIPSENNYNDVWPPPNGIYDLGESFIDLNGNGVYDYGVGTQDTTNCP